MKRGPTTSHSRYTSSSTSNNSTSRFTLVLTAVSIMVTNLLSFFRWLYKTIMTWWQSWTGPVITMDNGMQVRVGPQLAEGGFSFVFSATMVDENNHNNNNHHRRSKAQQKRAASQKYALKRIFVSSDKEILQGCLKEADVHHSVQHPNLMPLLAFLKTNDYCYMLFPLCSHSLREEVNQRTGLLQQQEKYPAAVRQTCPWSSECQVLQLFYRICLGVQAMHEARYTHRDIKLENILLRQTESLPFRKTHVMEPGEPVLMDFGSAGPLVVSLKTRHELRSVVEMAAQQTTLPYRPPELLDTTGMLHMGDELDYRAVDVWSLGCTLFAMLYGASPMECEFSRNDPGRVKIVDCTTLRILNHNIPTPPPQSPAASWYSREVVQELIPDMLQQDRSQRPTLLAVLSRLQGLIEARGERVPMSPKQKSNSNSSLTPFQVDSNSQDSDEGFGDFYASTV